MRRFAVAAALLCAALTGLAQAANFIDLSGDPGATILAGTHVRVSNPTFGEVLAFPYKAFTFSSSQLNGDFYFRSADPGPLLAVGTYENGRDGFWPLGRHPGLTLDIRGLTFDAQGRSKCGRNYNRFVVREMVYAADQLHLAKFAVDFEFHCNGETAALFGGIRVNSDVPYAQLQRMPMGPTFLQLDSRPGDPIGGGQQYLFSIPEAVFTPNAYPEHAALEFDVRSGTSDWFLSFGDVARALTIGSYDPSAIPSDPPFAVSHAAPMTTCPSGHHPYAVRDIVRDDDGWILSFAADFEVWCNAGPGVLRGSIRYNSSVALPPPASPTADPSSPQDLWWGGSAENGWGMSLIKHGDVLFPVIYAYDATGKPTWYAMPGGQWNSSHTAYTGSLYQPRGSPYFQYDAAHLTVGSPVGTATLTFLDASNAQLDYTIGAMTGRKGIARQPFGAADGADHGTNADMWWGGPTQDGWGVAVLQQYATLFAAWFTYDAVGSPTWFVMPGGTWMTANSYEGRVYRTTSSPWLGVPYDASKLQSTDVGSFRFTFAGNTAALGYTIEGHSGSLSLSRQPF